MRRNEVCPVFQEQIERYFADKEEELAAVAARLIAIPSVAGKPAPGKPFGEGPALALSEAIKLAAELGLPVENVDGYAAAADLNEMETRLHILTHLDVVDGGTDWTVTEPFTPLVRDGLLYGRGAGDDKGPTAAALLALRAVKDLDIPLRYNARLIMGTDEENGCSDIAYYYRKHPYAPYTFSPDAEFPLINIEKGHYHPLFSGTWPAETVLPRVISVAGGPRINVVPSEARAVVAGLGKTELRHICDKAETETGARFFLSMESDGIHILCTGTGGHAAEADKANNALTALLQLLNALSLASCSSTEALRALHTLFPHGDNLGKALGIARSDALSGDLTVAFTMLTLGETGFEARFDSRTALCATDRNCRQAVESAFARYGIAVTAHQAMKPPHHTPADSSFIKTLLDCYELYTGEKGACLAIGGATYVHEIPGGVAFGCTMPGFETGMHGPDERMSLHDLLTSAKIFAEVIARICSTQH